jgi:hypothetical protein
MHADEESDEVVSHAVEPPALCRLDAGADQAAGR